MQRLLSGRFSTTALARPSSSSPAKPSSVQAAARKLGGVAAKFAAANKALRGQLRDAAPEDAGKVLLAAAPELVTNWTLSASDETQAGKELAAALHLKPSTITLVTAGALAVFGPRKARKARRALLKVAIGAAHSVVGRLGRRTPAALQSALGNGNARTSGAAPATGDYPPQPGERTEA